MKDVWKIGSQNFESSEPVSTDNYDTKLW